MLGIIYIILCFFIGYNIFAKFLAHILKFSKAATLCGNTISLRSYMIIVPSSYLIGTISLTWITYIFSYFFKKTSSPLFYGNLITFLICTLFITSLIIPNKKHYIDFFNKLKLLKLKAIFSFLSENKLELYFILLSAIVWSMFMFRSLYIKENVVHVGYSVFSDFGPHLSVIRSFSYGSNFPTEYPHFPDGTIRYHFMFQFLAGNLEFLGLDLSWAFNLPSILSIVSFLMLLYSFTIILFGKKSIAMLASVMFLFRSSFAYFTFSKNFKSIGNLIKAIANNKDINGEIRANIGNTLHEDWGLWSQKVFVNQRHLCFAMGIMMLILIILIPYFKKTLDSIKSFKTDDDRLIKMKKKKKIQPKKSIKKPLISFLKYIQLSLIEIFFKKDSWVILSLKTSIITGLILGLISFWNGAVVIATLLILFFIAIFSKHKLDFLIVAAVTVILSILQSRLFIGTGNSAVNPEIYIGFLTSTSSTKNIKLILKYYIELLGILPFLFILPMFRLNKIKSFTSFLIVLLITITSFLTFTPDMSVLSKSLIIISLVLYIYILYLTHLDIPNGFRWLTLSFISPIILATTLKLTPDITVNHKYIILAAILLNIIAAYFIHSLFNSKKFIKVLCALLILFIITSTGIVDYITLYNMDKNTVNYDNNDDVLKWCIENTDPHAIFLTYMHVSHPILLSGRKIFYGWPYFTSTAGYDVRNREIIVKEIYGGTDINKVKELIKENNISYVSIENENRTSNDYKLNEELFANNFPIAYQNPARGIIIYRTN